MNALTRKALADITRRKGRTLLAILGIVIGVLGLTAVNEATNLLSGAFFYTTDVGAVPDMTLTVDHLPAAVATTIQHLPNVAIVQMRTTYMTLWFPAGQSEPVNIEIDSDQDAQRLQLGAFQLTSGRMPGPGEIVMDTGTEALLPVALGDTVKVGALDGQPVALRVVGLARTRGLAIWHSPALAIAYMRADALQQLMQSASGPIVNQFPRGTQLLIKTRDPSLVQQTYDQITQILTGAQLQIVPGVSRFHYSSFDADAQLGVVGLLMIIRGLAALALLLVCVLIFNTVTTLLTEQLKVIGTMKALGGTRWRIGRSYLLTVGIYSLIGTALGVGAGLVAGYDLAARLAGTVQIQVGENLSLPVDVGPFQVSPWVPLVGALVGLLAPALSALWPLWMGTRITVREAIAAYGVRMGARTHLAAWGRWLRWVPQTVWLGLRGLFRRRGRAALTLLALTLSGGIFLAVQITNASLRANLAYLENPFHSDFRIDLGQSLGDTVPSQPAVAALQRLPDVERVEPIDPVLTTVASRELELYGLSADTQLYQPELVAGRWLRSSDRGALVINDFAAARLHLQVGERITFTVNTQPASLVIVGIIHEVEDVSGSANTYGRLGAAFTTLDDLNQIRHTSADAAERLWLRARDRSPTALHQLQVQIEQTLRALNLEDATALALQQDLAQGSAIQVTIYLLFDATAILVALLGLLGLSHTLLASVLERRLEIGILRSVGATGWRVGLVFGTEALGLAALAWGLGAVLGVPASLAILALLGIYFGPVDLTFQPVDLLTLLLFLLAVACLASFAPALAAARTRIRGTLRYE
jgi:putative ABC transport system permease protein